MSSLSSGARIELTPDGLRVIDRGELAGEVRWGEVIGIAAHKRDLWSVDEICLRFITQTDGPSVYVSEHDDGYKDLVAEVERRFPDHDPEWWSKAAFPPFATCWTTVWGAAPEPAECPACKRSITGVTVETCPHCGGDLRTRRCPTCHGRGVLPGGLGWRLTTTLCSMGLALIGGGIFVPALSAGSGAIITLGVALIGGALAAAAPWPWARRWPCTECEETGWWDPRGRACRRIPEQSPIR